MKAAAFVLANGDARARELGRTNEARVLAALHREDRPVWIESARFATREEDHAGVDVVVATTEGELLLQVKSSQTGARQWRWERRKRGLPVDTIGLVVVAHDDCDERVFGKVLGALILLRERAEAGA